MSSELIFVFILIGLVGILCIILLIALSCGYRAGIKVTEQRWSEAVTKADADVHELIAPVLKDWFKDRYHDVQVNESELEVFAKQIMKAVQRKP